jgi:hypothetical protein
MNTAENRPMKKIFLSRGSVVIVSKAAASLFQKGTPVFIAKTKNIMANSVNNLE